LSLAQITLEVAFNAQNFRLLGSRTTMPCPIGAVSAAGFCLKSCVMLIPCFAMRQLELRDCALL
jgi:hypothetical protein